MEEENFGECIEKAIQECLFGNKETMEEQIKIDIPKGYKFVCIDDDNQKVVLEKIKLKYPKTYEECCEVLNLGEDGKLYTKGYKSALIQSIHQLLICRDAYWKLASDWKSNEHHIVYNIYRYIGGIKKSQDWGCNYLLEFPNKKMRNAFYENFKDIIEFCKELL